MTSRPLNQLPALLTVEQVAEQLGISRARCYQLIKGEHAVIPSLTVGRLAASLPPTWPTTSTGSGPTQRPPSSTCLAGP